MASLHDYQNDIKSRLAEAWREHRSVMVQMPTGTGKTHVLAAVVRDFLADVDDGVVWIVAHRRELVAQTEETIARYGIAESNVRVRVLSIQWLSRHWTGMEAGERPSLVIVDEAHHAQARTYRMLWDRLPGARFLGLTATPCRMNRSGFTDLFDVLLTSWSISEFIRKGRLSLFDYVSIRPDSGTQMLIDGLEKRGADGDYQIKEMNDTLNRKQSIVQLYESVRRYADGRKGIVYAVSIAHARAIADYYSSRGLTAVAIDSRTPAAERKRLVSGFRKGRTAVLVNVDVFSEGFDCPDVEFVQMARPTLSLAKYLQQVGRGLRMSEGKTSCVLIDNVGLYRVFGLPTAAWDWEAMFRGESAGKGVRAINRQASLMIAGTSACPMLQDCEMELIVSHDALLSAIEKQEECQSLSLPVSQKMTAWRDDATGLWGLKVGRRRTTEAVFAAVTDIGYGMAAVRYGDSQCGLVDSSGREIGERRYCQSMKFSKDRILTVLMPDGRIRYVDLYNMKEYAECPKVKRFGDVELLRIRDMYYSRTVKRYVNGQGLCDNDVRKYKSFVLIFDYHVPSDCRSGRSFSSGYRCGHACLVAGEHETFYWLYRRLADGSIIVTDAATGRYYHLADGKPRRSIGCSGTDSGSDAGFGAGPDVGSCVGAEVAERSAEAERSAVEIERLAKRTEAECRVNEQRKKRKTLGMSDAAVPFQSGMKWGLRVGERITVPPIYRHVKWPVGRYCAVEKNYGQWGVIAIDGTLMVEPRYSDIEINSQGIVTGTNFMGRKTSLKLP
ncbi:MAG: DEAD/DEAH box helicase [Prevotella sp.]|nr:DEAD/DEAH box helicase [Prevotella sp.]